MSPDTPERQTFEHILKASGLSRAMARTLMAHAASSSREWLLAHATDPCPMPTAAKFTELTRRAHDGEPLAYLCGHREFHGHTLNVSPHVLIPRPETETLVDWAIEHLPDQATAVDLGTGSGAVAIAIAAKRPDVYMMATDTSHEAIAIARSNAAQIGVDIEFGHGNWWGGLPGTRKINAVLCNPPYVAANDPHLLHDGLDHEPALALIAGEDGFSALRTIIAAMPRARLANGAWLMFEHGYDQAARLRKLLYHAGLSDIQTMRDDQGHERFSGGRYQADTADPGRSEIAQ